MKENHPRFEDSEIVKLYLQGYGRDETARKTGDSTGKVSNVIKQFIEDCEGTSLTEAAEKYDVVEQVEVLRSLACQIKKSRTTVSELAWTHEILDRVNKLCTLEKLEEFVNTGERFKDKTFVEASMRLHSLEEKTGKSYEQILLDHESKEAGVKKHAVELDNLQSENRKMEDERSKMRQAFNAEKSRLETELEEHLKEHNTSMQAIGQYGPLLRSLSDSGINPAEFETIQNVLNSIKQTGGDNAKLVETLKKKEAADTQLDIARKAIAELEEKAARLRHRIATMKKELAKRSRMLKVLRQLESHGWTTEGLIKARKFTRLCGSPEEALTRMQLAKSIALLEKELENVKQQLSAARNEQTKVSEQNRVLVESNRHAMVVTCEASQRNNVELAAAYNALVDRHAKQMEECNQMSQKHAECKTVLDDAIDWTTLLTEPAKLSLSKIFEISAVFFQKLGLWMKSRNASDVAEMLGMLAPSLLATYHEDVANFLEAPAKAETPKAKRFLLAYCLFTANLYVAARDWHLAHEEEGKANGFDLVICHMNRLYTEALPTLNRHP